MRASDAGRHISGAEGIFSANSVLNVARKYTSRAMRHERGAPDNITITIEALTDEPELIRTLPVSTMKNEVEAASNELVCRLLASVGVSGIAATSALELLRGGDSMRGAALMDMAGQRLEPDRARGVRVSRIGITDAARARLRRLLRNFGIDSETVIEALVLASKVNHHPKVIAELCVSDDPGYTTGYVASSAFGYLRIPHIKAAESSSGGRVFFVSGGEVSGLIDYLERAPVMAASVGPVFGTFTADEFFEGAT
jgi:6-carboxyhexanoate--CoA ligase